MLSPIGQSGVTLIEAMIAIAIMSILLAMGVPGFQSWMQNSQVRTAAEAVQNGLQLARAEAARANTKVSFSLNGNDWSVTCNASAVTNGACPAVVQSRSGQEGSPNAVITSAPSVPINGVTVTMSGFNTLWFNGMGRLTTDPATGTSPTSDTTFTITNPRAGACATPGAAGVRCLNVIVKSNSGQIRMCDPALSLAANPQGCY